MYPRGESDNERGQAKGTHAAALGVLLLYPTDVSRDVLDARLVLERQSVRLRLKASFIDEHASVRGETRESDAHVIVHHLDLTHGARILELCGGLLLHAEHDAVGAADAHGEGTLAHSFHGVFNLKAGGDEGVAWKGQRWE